MLASSVSLGIWAESTIAIAMVGKGKPFFEQKNKHLGKKLLPCGGDQATLWCNVRSARVSESSAAEQEHV